MPSLMFKMVEKMVLSFGIVAENVRARRDKVSWGDGVASGGFEAARLVWNTRLVVYEKKQNVIASAD